MAKGRSQAAPDRACAGDALTDIVAAQPTEIVAARPTQLEPGPQLHAGMFKEQTIREVLRLLKVLKGPEAADEPDAVVAALDELADYCVDREVLERTSVAIEVKKLQRHREAVVAQRAEALCEQWRRDFDVRKKAIEGFIEKGALKKRDARELEESLFNSWCPLGLLEGPHYKAYQQHYKRLCTHLRTRGSGSLVQRLQDRQLSCTAVALLPDAELLSREQRQQQREAQEEGLRAALAGPAEAGGTVTHEYVCPKCQSTKTSYQELQTGWHSDQQDLTILVRCLDCGERWKEGDDHGLAGS